MLLNSYKSNMDSPMDSTKSLEPISGKTEHKNKVIPGRKDVLLERLKKYYSANNSCKAAIVKNVVCGNTVLSLRIIDWFVTNYSRDFDIKYVKRGEMFSVYSDYKNQLKAFSKKMFDPFCRRERVNIPEIGETTIGQMNFFKWAIESGIIEYSIVHVKEIEQNMVSSQSERSIRKNKPPETNKNNMSPAQTSGPESIKRARKTNKKQAGFIRDDIDTVIKFN